MIMEYFMYKNMETDNNNSEKNKENYYSYKQVNYQDMRQREQMVEPMSTPLTILVFIIYLILGIYAARLSWYSNTEAGWSQGYKVLFAIIAFMFPITYITVHILFKLDLLSIISKGSKGSKSL